MCGLQPLPGAAPERRSRRPESKDLLIDFVCRQLEQPGGIVSPGDGRFTPAIFNPFDSWANLPAKDPRAAIARGEALFNSLPINITGVAGINDDV
jgi:hypothetical protein